MSGSIAVDDRRVYASAGNTPTAVETDSGDAVWNAGVGERTSHAGPPVVDETTVYVSRTGERTDDGPQGAVFAFEKRSGDRQ
jgi:outer membrane protein assembly factor BamB